MAQPLSPRRAAALLLVGCTWASLLTAQTPAPAEPPRATLPDPARRARPDPMRPTPAEGQGPPSAPLAPVAPDPDPATLEPPRLVSVRQLQGQAPMALLGDQWVQQGELVGSWRVLHIGEDRVSLKRGRELRVVQLWPILRAP